MKTNLFSKRVLWLLIPLLTLFNVNAWGGTATKTEGFQTATTNTTYNSTRTLTTAQSDCGIAWSIYYGNVSGTSAITGSKSCLMRYYSSSSSNLGYAKTTTAIKGLTNVTFNAKVTKTDVKMGVWYSTDGSSWTAIATGVTLTTSSASKSYNIPSSNPATNYYIKIGITAASTDKKDLIIDDIVFTHTAYTVTYNGNSNTSGSVPTDATKYLSGETVTVKSNSGSLAKTGYTFSGWNTNASGTGTNYTAGSGTFSITSDITLYAKWVAAGTTVTYSKGASSNGSFTLSPASSVTTTSSAQNVTVLCTPNTGYYVSNVTATNPATGTATVTGSGNSWNVQYSSGANGSSTITVTFSPIWYLEGDFNSWDASIPLTNITSNVATVDLSFSKTTAYEFKVYNAQTDAWYGNNGKIIDDVSGWTFSTSENNCTVFATVADDYTFNFNISNQQMQVVYPDMTHPNDAYVYLTNWWDCYVHWWGASGDLTSWGSDLQLNRHEEICETDYWCVPILDGYPSLIMKDNAGDASNSTGDQTTNSNAGKYITHNGVSWGWHDFATYTISYAGGGGTGSMSSHTDLCPGSSQALTANTFSKTHYTFDGWHADVNVKVGGSTITAGNKINNSVTLQDIQSNVNLTAQWAANSYTVTTNLTNVTPNSAFPASVTYTGTTTTALNRTLTVNTTNFSLPTSITVSMAGTGTLTQGTHYTYNNSTGAFAFNVAVTGNITITATAVAKLMSIAITTQPTKRTYFAGETFSSTGAVVTATWGDASTTNVTGSATWTPTSALNAGTSQTVTATYSGKTATTTINVYSVTVNKVDEGGTAIADAGVTATWTVGSKALTASAGSTNYVFKNWEFSGSNNGLTISNTNSASTTVTGTPTGNVTINAVFYNPVTITWSNNGVTSTTTTAYNTKPTFPSTPASCHPTSTTFIGWASSPWDGTLDDVSDKTIHTTNSSMDNATSATTYYAVFAKAVAGDPVYTAVSTVTAGTYVMVSKYSSSYYYMPNTTSSSSNPALGSGITVSEGALTNTVTADMLWDFTTGETSGYFYVRPHGSTTIGLGTTNNTGAYIRISGTYKDTEWSFTTHNTHGWDIYNDAMYLAVYSADAWRNYSNNTTNQNGTFYMFKESPGVSYSKYLTTCCENIMALTAGATDATTHCTSLTFSNDNLPTCSDEPTDRRVTITVTPYDGYAAPAELTYSGDGTAAYVSGPTGSGPYTYVYEFDQNDDGDGIFTATCTPKAISLVLDKNNSDVSGSANGSATVYFDATSLSTISHATRLGHVLDGYYAEPGCTNKVLTDAGALVNYTGYVVSTKWARATTPTTLYAKWIAKSFEDYKFSCADLSLTDEEEAVSKTPIWITTSAGQIVRSQKALHIEGTGLKPSSTFAFTIGGVDANDCSGTGEHDLFAIRQADYSAVATDASGNIDMDVYVFYNPTGATDGLDLAGSTIVATSASGTVAGKEYMSLSVTLSTTSVNGRHLPNQFVMAARIGKTWYALPGNITTNATQDPVMIGVDNATNPTIAYCPAAYGFRIVSLASTEAHPNGNTANNAVDARGFYTDGEKVKLCLQNNHPMFGSTTTTLGPSSASSLWSGGKDYFWTLEHQNTAASNINAVTYNIRTANTNSNPLIRLSRGQWKWGLYSNGVEEIRLLSISPVQDLTLEVMEWGTTAIAVKYNGGGSLTNVKIGDSEEGEATMSTICGDIKRISGLSSLVAGASGKQGQQMLIQITESEVLKQKIVQVPFIVNSTDVTTDNLRTWTGGATIAEQDSITYNMEIVVRPGAKITTNNGSGKFGKLSIYPGGVADISNAIRLAHFTMRGGYSWLGGAFAMPHAKVTGNVTGTGNQVVYDYYIDATKYYDLAVPKTMTWLPVTDETGNEDFTFWVKWYNGATRASTGKGWTWYDWSGEASSWSINMGQGYLVAAQPPTGRNYFIMRFPMSITLASDESTKAPIAVTAHGMTAGSLNPGISANNAGWNLIANPFLTSYKKDADGVDGGGDAISGSIAIGELVPEIKEGNPTGKYVWDATGAKNIRYVTTYDYATATYEQHPMSSTVLEPFTGFFIQVAKDCYVRFDASGRQNNIIRRRVESLPDDMEIGITASSDEESDETILLLCDDLSRDNALEFPDESSKLINEGHLNFYTFAGATSMYANGMSYAEGQEWNAAGITPTKSGVYSFTVTKVNTSYVESVLLKDLVTDVEYDLLKDNVDIHLDPGTIDDRFLVKIVLKNEEETPTALDEITEGSINQRPEKIIYNDKMYIRYNGVLYDATGKRVREVNK